MDSAKVRSASVEVRDLARRNPALGAAQEAVGRQLVDGRDFWVVGREAGSSRLDLPIFTAPPGTVSLEDEEDKLPVQRVDIPEIRGAFLLRNVLTPAECEQIIAVSEAMGYTEDAPVSLDRSVRQNDNCVWIADDFLNGRLFARCAPLLEPGALGLNARWRLYKYHPKDIFRPHTDGAWPGSGLDRSTGALVHDMYGDRLSQLTWVLYLNDDFEGGCTRFFEPVGPGNEFRTSGSVAAERGAVLCFWHGGHPLSPLHEGSLVMQGTKYIVRSDVLYPLRNRPEAHL